MRTLGLICSVVALLGMLAYFYLKDSTPSFVVPMILVSGTLAILLILVSSIVGIRERNRKIYQCVECKKKLTGRRLRKAGNVCPNCGCMVFA
jgi:DNA-directed RNA polymerase subunit RPC12/RpoP